MLQFNGIVYIMTTKYTPRLLWRLSTSLSTNSMIVTSNYNEQQKQTEYQNNKINLKRHKIFNELKTNLRSSLCKDPLILNEIQKAQNIDELMQIMKSGNQFSISQNDILNAFQIIMNWTLNKYGNEMENLNNKDISSKSNITIPMKTVNNLQNNIKNVLLPYNQFNNAHRAIKEVYKLAKKCDRNTQVLNVLFENIIDNHKFMNIIHCSTLLYCMGSLSYSDQRLLKNIAEYIKNTDVISGKICKSMLKSMVVIRYRNGICLEHICKQIINGNIKCTLNEIVDILQSFAMLDYYSTYVNKIIEDYISDDQFMNLVYNDKLNFVWSCVIFKILKNSHAESVLDKKFVSAISQGAEENVTKQMKLLNINAYAKYVLKDYSGSFLDDEQCPKMKSKYRSKQPYIDTLESALKHLLPTPLHFEMNVDTKMGFYLDAEFAVDSKCNFVDIHKVEDNKDFYRVAVLVVDYHHIYLGTTHFVSLLRFYYYLLKQRNYVVLLISYRYLSLKDQVDKNANYIKEKLLCKLKKVPFKFEI